MADRPTTPDRAPDAPPGGVGNEYLWIDEEITWDRTRAGLVVSRPAPADWVRPIDYANGRAYFRLDVKTKADATPLWLELCLWNDRIGSTNHTCLHCIDNLTRPGHYECSDDLRATGNLDLGKPIAAMQHRVKDAIGGDRGLDLIGTPSPALPMSGRYTIVLVPAGATFSDWGSYR